MIPQTNLGANGISVQFKGEEKRAKDITKSFFMTHVPHAGNWMQRSSNGANVPRQNGSVENRPLFAAPAGLNMPTTLKLSYPDKIPKLMQTLRNEGASEFKIKEALQRKELAANDRYGNRSTVGYLIQMNTPVKDK